MGCVPSKQPRDPTGALQRKLATDLDGSGSQPTAPDTLSRRSVRRTSSALGTLSRDDTASKSGPTHKLGRSSHSLEASRRSLSHSQLPNSNRLSVSSAHCAAPSLRRAKSASPPRPSPPATAIRRVFSDLDTCPASDFEAPTSAPPPHHSRPPVPTSPVTPPGNSAAASVISPCSIPSRVASDSVDCPSAPLEPKGSHPSFEVSTSPDAAKATLSSHRSGSGGRVFSRSGSAGTRVTAFNASSPALVQGSPPSTAPRRASAPRLSRSEVACSSSTSSVPFGDMSGWGRVPSAPIRVGAPQLRPESSRNPMSRVLFPAPSSAGGAPRGSDGSRAASPWSCYAQPQTSPLGPPVTGFPTSPTTPPRGDVSPSPTRRPRSAPSQVKSSEGSGCTSGSSGVSGSVVSDRAPRAPPPLGALSSYSHSFSHGRVVSPLGHEPRVSKPAALSPAPAPGRLRPQNFPPSSAGLSSPRDSESRRTGSGSRDRAFSLVSDSTQPPSKAPAAPPAVIPRLGDSVDIAALRSSESTLASAEPSSAGPSGHIRSAPSVTALGPCRSVSNNNLQGESSGHFESAPGVMSTVGGSMYVDYDGAGVSPPLSQSSETPPCGRGLEPPFTSVQRALRDSTEEELEDAVRKVAIIPSEVPSNVAAHLVTAERMAAPFVMDIYVELMPKAAFEHESYICELRSDIEKSLVTLLEVLGAAADFPSDTTLTPSQADKLTRASQMIRALAIQGGFMQLFWAVRAFGEALAVITARDLSVSGGGETTTSSLVVPRAQREAELLQLVWYFHAISECYEAGLETMRDSLPLRPEAGDPFRQRVTLKREGAPMVGLQ